MRYSWDQIEEIYKFLIKSIENATVDARTYLVVFGDDLKTNARSIIDLIPLLKKHVSDRDYFIGLGHDILFIANLDAQSSPTIHISSWQAGIYEVEYEDSDSVETREEGPERVIETVLELLDRLQEYHE